MANSVIKACESCLGEFNYNFSGYEDVLKCNACRNDTEECRDYDEDAEFCPHTQGEVWSTTSPKQFPF